MWGKYPVFGMPTPWSYGRRVDLSKMGCWQYSQEPARKHFSLEAKHLIWAWIMKVEGPNNQADFVEVLFQDQWVDTIQSLSSLTLYI